MNTSTSTQYGNNYSMEMGVKKELWMWRGASILILLANLILLVQFEIADNGRHAFDNKERAQHWTEIENGLERNRNMIYNVDDHLRACLGCHAHDAKALWTPTRPSKK
jgi:hypothetical protein